MEQRNVPACAPPRKRSAALVAVTCRAEQANQPPGGIAIEESAAEEVLSNHGYSLRKLIDRGSYSNVYDALRTSSGTVLAVKLVERQRYLVDEIQALRLLAVCPQVIELVDVFESDEHVGIVTELAQGGNLFDVAVGARDAQSGAIQPADIGTVMARVVQGVAYMHDELGIVHRDLKLDNVVLMHPGDYSSATIIDFGMVAARADNGICVSLVDKSKIRPCGGTPDYVSPEMLTESVMTQASDMWAVGVMLYIMFAGYAPFTRDDGTGLAKLNDTYQAIVDHNFIMPIDDLPGIPDAAVALVTSLLSLQPDQRPTARECIEDSWLTQFIEQS